MCVVNVCTCVRTRVCVRVWMCARVHVHFVIRSLVEKKLLIVEKKLLIVDIALFVQVWIQDASHLALKHPLSLSKKQTFSLFHTHTHANAHTHARRLTKIQPNFFKNTTKNTIFFLINKNTTKNKIFGNNTYMRELFHEVMTERPPPLAKRDQK